MTCKYQLPRWATLHTPLSKQKEDDDEVDIEQDEIYLRGKAYHCLANVIDQTFQESQATLVEESFQVALSKLLQSVGEEQETEFIPSPSKKQKVMVAGTQQAATTVPETGSKVPHELEQFCIEPTTKKGPSSMPILVVHGPSHFPDRVQWLSRLVAGNKKQRPTTCNVWLPLDRSVEDWKHEVVRQVLKQVKKEDVPPCFQSRRFRRVSSVAEQLQEWARHTSEYKHITVFTELEKNNNYHFFLSIFLEWIIDLRALHGIPVSMVLLTAASDLPFDTTSAHIQIRHYVLPSSSQLLTAFWNRLMQSKKFPLVLPAAVEQELSVMFTQQNKSALDVVDRFKTWLAYFFCQKGSFLVVANTLHSERTRILWFITDAEARAATFRRGATRSSLLQWIDGLELRRRFACACRVQAIRNIVHSTKRNEPAIFSGATLRTPAPLATSTAFDDRIRKAILNSLMRVRRSAKQRMAGFCPQATGMNYVNATLCVLNQLIIFFGNHCKSADDCRLMSLFTFSSWENHVNELFGGIHLDNVQEILSPQPRQNVMKGILNQNPSLPADKFVPLVGQLLYLAIDRLSILRSEWFELYRASFDLPEDSREAQLNFSYAIGHLKACGIIRERNVPGRKDVRYEKMVVVWCNA